MQAYLDNSATTVCEPGVVEKVVQMMSITYGNPSAMHNKGVEAENYVKEAKEIIAKTLKGKGVSFMEDVADWHGKAPNDEEYQIAMEDLKKVGEALCQK